MSPASDLIEAARLEIQVRLEHGGSLTALALVKSIAATDLQTAPKWTRFPSRDPAAEHSGYRLADLFAIRRGIATGGNHFFILPEEDIRHEYPRLWAYLQTGADTATNVFLMLYPNPALARRLALDPSVMRRLWTALNAIRPETLTGEGRVYGGGLHTLEPRELANVPADDLAALVGLPSKTVSTDQEDFTWA